MQKNINDTNNIVYTESYGDYLNYIKNINPDNYKWVYNILEGKAEQEDILYQDEQILIIPSDTWVNKNDMTQFHYLVFPKDNNLKTIRSLNGTHILLLEHILDKSFKLFNDKYKISHNNLLVYVHYPPSTYYLHIHFSSPLVKKTSFQYSHGLHQIIYNLKINPNYYKEIDLYRSA
jgi:m7GpppX diphosphatase